MSNKTAEYARKQLDLDNFNPHCKSCDRLYNMVCTLIDEVEHLEDIKDMYHDNLNRQHKQVQETFATVFDHAITQLEEHVEEESG